ncbi:MAG: hypothetical protein MI723_06250 [Caulobacterales bacterium]|nr:hypothetical protein [Caulobacterales bacterium]
MRLVVLAACAGASVALAPWGAALAQQVNSNVQLAALGSDNADQADVDLVVQITESAIATLLAANPDASPGEIQQAIVFAMGQVEASAIVKQLALLRISQSSSSSMAVASAAASAMSQVSDSGALASVDGNTGGNTGNTSGDQPVIGAPGGGDGQVNLGSLNTGAGGGGGGGSPDYQE